jgi:murein DD-endopeptidase MepM/ murein hydrolase activator NlpD
LDITVVLDKDDKIAGLTFLPSTPPIPVPDRLVTSFQLPFEGQWLVFWGGDTRELNRHHDSPQERFAFDFLVVDEAGRSFQNDGKDNEDYYAFGQPVLAPADGVVTDVITGVRDNTPGSMNPSFAAGNTVILRHREHEVSVLCHFQQGGIQVKRGERVKQGQVLGFCGNSGMSSEPHIHFHVQNTPITQDATGLRCTFEKIAVTRNGEGESRMNYSPVKGDIVSRE